MLTIAVFLSNQKYIFHLAREKLCKWRWFQIHNLEYPKIHRMLEEIPKFPKRNMYKVKMMFA
jgi:hypothetical protein